MPKTNLVEEIAEVLVSYLNTITVYGENEPNIPHQQVIFKGYIPEIAQAIAERIELDKNEKNRI